VSPQSALAKMQKRMESGSLAKLGVKGKKTVSRKMRAKKAAEKAAPARKPGGKKGKGQWGKKR